MCVAKACALRLYAEFRTLWSDDGSTAGMASQFLVGLFFSPSPAPPLSISDWVTSKRWTTSERTHTEDKEGPLERLQRSNPGDRDATTQRRAEQMNQRCTFGINSNVERSRRRTSVDTFTPL